MHTASSASCAGRHLPRLNMRLVARSRSPCADTAIHVRQAQESKESWSGIGVVGTDGANAAHLDVQALLVRG